MPLAPLDDVMVAHALGATALAGLMLGAAGADEGRPTHHTVTGTVSAYDAESRLLTVHSPTGSFACYVAHDARAWLGRRKVSLRQLAAHIGAQVTLAWSEANGRRTTHTVRLEERRADVGTGRAR